MGHSKSLSRIKAWCSERWDSRMRIIVVVWAVVFAFDFFARFTGFSSSAGEGYTAQVASPQKSIPILNEVGLVQYQEKLTAYVNARLANQDRLAEQGQPQAIDSDLSDGDLVEGPGYDSLI